MVEKSSINASIYGFAGGQKRAKRDSDVEYDDCECSSAAIQTFRSGLYTGSKLPRMSEDSSQLPKRDSSNVKFDSVLASCMCLPPCGGFAETTRRA